MSETSSRTDPWRKCLPGELGRMVERIGSQQRRQMLKRAGGAAALVVVGVAGYWAADWLLQPRRYPGGIACKDVRRLLKDYHARRLRPDRIRAIAVHLEHCRSCNAAYRRMFEQAVAY